MSTRVLHVTDASSSGVLAAATTIARAQSAREDLAVTFAYVPRGDSPPRAAIQELVGPRVRLRRWTRSPRAALPALALGLLGALVRERRAGGSVIVHLHSSRAGLIGRALAAATGLRSRTVYSPHCFAFDRSDLGAARRAVLVGLERLGTLLGPRLLLVSGTEQALADRTLPGARTAVLRNRVDVTALEELADAGRRRAPADDAAPSALRVVHVGRIAAQKRPAEFAAVVRPQPGAPDLEARWLGDGDRALLGPDAAVHVTGWLDREQLVAELSRADLLLFTSAGEGMPIAVLEAQALGVPVLAHDVTGLADVVEEGVTGLLRVDTADLRTALLELAADPERRRALSRAARTRTRERFDLHDLAHDADAAYRDLGIAPSAEDPRTRHALDERGSTA